MMPGSPGYRPPSQNPYPPPYVPYGPQMPPPVTDHRAIVSLALGILSVSCGGLLFGIPAILLGFAARKHIERSCGASTGLGLATGGIVTGFLGTAVSIVLTLAVAVAIALGPRGSAHPSSPHVSSGTSRASVGSIPVVELSSADGPLVDQLRAELVKARGAKKVLLLQTTAAKCGACDEIEDSLADSRMQSALSDVYLVRVDVDDFRSELVHETMWEGSVPWFYKIDSTAHPIDAISADEWDENVPENMAPVLRSFAAGTLLKRRHATQVGTPL